MHALYSLGFEDKQLGGRCAGMLLIFTLSWMRAREAIYRRIKVTTTWRQVSDYLCMGLCYSTIKDWPMLGSVAIADTSWRALTRTHCTGICLCISLMYLDHVAVAMFYSSRLYIRAPCSCVFWDCEVCTALPWSNAAARFFLCQDIWQSQQPTNRGGKVLGHARLALLSVKYSFLVRELSWEVHKILSYSIWRKNEEVFLVSCSVLLHAGCCIVWYVICRIASSAWLNL